MVRAAAEAERSLKTRVKRLEAQVKRLGGTVERLEDRLKRAQADVKRLEKYARLNYKWAVGMKRWGDEMSDCCELVSRKLEMQFMLGDVPPKPPKWPPA